MDDAAVDKQKCVTEKKPARSLRRRLHASVRRPPQPKCPSVRFKQDVHGAKDRGGETLGAPHNPILKYLRPGGAEQCPAAPNGVLRKLSNLAMRSPILLAAWRSSSQLGCESYSDASAEETKPGRAVPMPNYGRKKDACSPLPMGF